MIVASLPSIIAVAITATQAETPSRNSAGLSGFLRPTPAPPTHAVRQAFHERRFVTTTVCGYVSGAASRPLIANSGSICRHAMTDRLWGPCSITITDGYDCNFPAMCYDLYDCSTGCGRVGTATLTCSQTSQYCMTNIMTSGMDIELFSIGCWFTPEVNLVAITPTSLPDITIPNTGRSDISKTSSPSSTSTSAPSSTQSDASSKSSPSESLQPGSSTSIPQATTATSSPTPTSTEPTDSSSSGPRLNLGAIVAGILGGLALICITIILVIYIVRNNRSEKSNRPPISRPRPQKPKWSFLAVSKRNTKDSDVSSEDTITLHETPYPDPPDNKAHPEAGWGPSEAYGSEVAPHRGPWEMLNEERSHEMSDHNRPAELPDHAFLETLPTIPQAPTRQDSWRPNDDGAAWGDLRAPPRIRDRLRYASPQTAAAEGLSGNVAAANFAAPGWGRRDDHTRAPVPYGQSADIRRQKTSAGRQEMAQGPAMSDDGMRQAQHRTGGGIPSATASVSSHGSLYTSSPTKF